MNLTTEMLNRDWSTWILLPLLFIPMLIVTLFKSLVSKKGRRIIYIATIQHELQKSGVFEEGSMAKINQVLQLVNNMEALMLSTAISDKVWQHDVLSHIVKDNVCEDEGDVCQKIDQAKSICERILAITPKWLQYSDKEEMLSELLQMFTSQKTHLSPHQ